MVTVIIVGKVSAVASIAMAIEDAINTDYFASVLFKVKANFSSKKFNSYTHCPGIL